MRALFVSLALLLSGMTAAVAHPMPDTEITVVYKEDRLILTIHVSLSDLALALEGLNRSEEALTEGEIEILMSYFGEHARLFTDADDPVAVSIDNVALLREQNPDVGLYEEVEVTASASATHGQSLVLEYDGVLHQVANHRAIVATADGQPLGTIRFDLTQKRATPLVFRVP